MECKGCKHKGAEPSLNLSRRKFFISVILLLGGMITSVLGWNVGRYFISPIWQLIKEGWVEVTALELLPMGIPTKVDYIQRKVDGWMTVSGANSVWLLRENDEVVAFNPRCTHLGCAYDWKDEKGVFQCPCHTAAFSKDGQRIDSTDNPNPAPRPLDRFPVKIVNDTVIILPELPKLPESKKENPV